LQQDYPNLEIIISDDCSTDSTWEIIAQTVDEYKGPHKLKLLRNHKNLGIIRNFESAILASQSDWIIGLAGDDVAYPDRVSYIASLVRNRQDIFAVGTAFDAIDSQGNSFYNITGQYDFRQLSFALPFYHGCTCAIRRDCLTRFPEIRADTFSEDTIFSFRALLLGGILLTNRSTLKHRYHDSNVSLSFIQNLSALNKALACQQACLPALEQCRTDGIQIITNSVNRSAVFELIDGEVMKRQSHIGHLKKAIMFYELPSTKKWRYLLGLQLDPSPIENLSAKIRLLLSSTRRLEMIFRTLFNLKQITKRAILRIRSSQPDFMEYKLNDFLHNVDNAF
jgi:glycosyltransferase involved in cell wall biosynthesis